MSKQDNDIKEILPRKENPLKGESKTSRIPVKIIPASNPLPKPAWIKARAHTGPEVARLKKILRQQNLYTVCEEAACPNLGECFNHGTATFMIMGDICTRRCPFCDVAHGKPKPLNEAEPLHLANTIEQLQLKYVVVTSVDRDDLRDGGAKHFSQCISKIREKNPRTKIEILTPDFRGRMDIALQHLADNPSDIFNHNLETVPRLYKQARPGADYQWSLTLLKRHKEMIPAVATKSGLMLGLGEEFSEVEQVMRDLRAHGVNMLTLGQYLQPSQYHLPVARYVTPEEFDALRITGEKMGFDNVASGPMVRSSYHADLQAAGNKNF